MMDLIARTIAAYDAQGNHRTGTDVDRLSGAWLANEIKGLGFEPIEERFPFSRIDIDTAAVQLAGETWRGTPIFDASYTALDGVSGSLGSLDSDADIAIAPVLPNVVGPMRQAYEAARRDGRYKAMIAVTDDRHVTGGVTLVNADDYTTPFGPPVLQMSRDHVTPIGERPRGEARNIYDGGGRYVSLLGTNPLFHHPDDRWPEAVDTEKTARLVQASVALALALAQ